METVHLPIHIGVMLAQANLEIVGMDCGLYIPTVES
jgi:hypothetical protein